MLAKKTLINASVKGSYVKDAIFILKKDDPQIKANNTSKAISKALGSMAAGIAALKGHQGTLYALSANAEAAAARIQDTDFARSSANLAKFSILNQSAMAMVSQANQANAAVLAVLN